MVSNNRLIKKSNHGLFIILFLCCCANFAFAGSKRVNNPLLDLTIEELIKVEVTTASRRSEKLTEVASAVFVITQDDTKRSGATNISEALRYLVWKLRALVPIWMA